jgi:DNA-binding transcriptional ArsR family regulator
MKNGLDIAEVAALIGDPARANILAALMSGKALTASELAAEAGVTRATASSHLSKLENGGLLAARSPGRYVHTERCAGIQRSISAALRYSPLRCAARLASRHSARLGFFITHKTTGGHIVHGYQRQIVYRRDL